MTNAFLDTDVPASRFLPYSPGSRRSDK